MSLRRRARWGIVGCALIAVLTAACTGVAQGGNTNSPASPTPTRASANTGRTPTVQATPTAQTSPSAPTSPTGGATGRAPGARSQTPLTAVDHVVSWAPVLGPGIASLVVLAQDEQALWYTHNSADDRETVFSRSGAQPRDLRMPIDVAPQWVYPTVRGVAYSTVNVNDSQPPAVWWWPGRSGEGAAMPVELSRATSTTHGGDTAAVGSRLFVAQTTPTQSCFAVFDLAADSPATTQRAGPCFGPGMWWLRGVGSTLSWLVPAAGTDAGAASGTSGSENCNDLMRWSGTGEPEQVGRGQCIVRGEASADIAVWAGEPATDAQGGQNWLEVPLTAEAGNATVNLGPGAAGSAHICGDTVVWQVAPGGAQPEIRSWKPGRDAVSVLFRAPDDGKHYLASEPMCLRDGQVGFQLVGYGDAVDTTDPTVFQVATLP